MVKSSTESVIITPELHRGKAGEREREWGEDVGAPKQKPPLSVLFSLCLPAEKKGGGGEKKDLVAKKGITAAVMTNDGEMEQDLIRITRVCCSRGSHSDVFADTRLVL